MTFDELVTVFRRWLLMPDDSLLRLVAACCVAHHLAGDPLWLLILAPSGSGKTEMLRPFSGLAFCRDVSKLTPRTLWSGHQAVDPLINQLDGKVIIVKEMGTLLSLNRNAIGEVLGQLREVYDGYLTADYGNGRKVVWNGRVGLVAAGVPMIERSLSLDSQLGERFIYYRPPEVERLETARRSLNHAGREEAMRKELSEAVTIWWNANPPVRGTRTPRADLLERLARLASWVTAVRSAPTRDHEHQIELATPPESPGRMPKALLALSGALAHVRGGGRLTRDDYALVRRVALDSAPAGKIGIIRALVDAHRPLTVAAIQEEIRVAHSTADRWCEDLWFMKVLDRAGAGRRGDAYLSRLAPLTTDLLKGTSVADFG